MSVIEFLNKKNKIVFDVTKLILIPEDQIEEVKKVKLIIDPDNKEDLDSLHTNICPYCIIYKCNDCPMNMAGNCCLGNMDSTWYEANSVWMDKAIKKDKDRLSKLINEYNSQF